MATQLPEHLTIGTKKAFAKNYPYPYQKTQFGTETVYVCSKGSEWAQTGEVLVLRSNEGTWTAYDGAVNAEVSTIVCRQPVFRCSAGNITRPGWYNWQTNYNANDHETGLSVNWQGDLWSETRVP